MNKGKIKEKNKQLSIVLVPHTSSKVRVFKVSTLYARLAVMLAMMFIFTFCIYILITYTDTLNENKKLKNSIVELYDENVEQNRQLVEKTNEIDQMKAKETDINDKVREFAEKYKELTENYISGRTDGNKSSRSGDRSGRSFSTDIKELKDILDSLNELNTPENRELVDLTASQNKLKKYLDTIPTFWPTSGRISDGFGYRIHPITRRKTFHEGLDIGAPYGQTIKAAASGKVTFVGRKSGYGYVAIVNHGHGISTLYGHASKLLVKEGQTVAKGEAIAKVGSTGTSTGPHLHFEVRINDTPVDPLKYLDSK